LREIFIWLKKGMVAKFEPTAWGNLNNMKREFVD
jgi:hypothetical protein